MSTLGKLFRGAFAAALTAAGAAPALAQTPDPLSTPDPTVQPAGFLKSRRAPAAGPGCQPDCQQCTPAPGTLPPGTTPPNTFPPNTLPPTVPEPTTPSPEPAFPNLTAGADAGPSIGLGGYIDNALPVTMFRLRYDSMYDNNRPDRAEFFYAKCGCFRTVNPPQLDAKGPPLSETSVDYQELTPYFEYAINPRFSLFANIPIRFINPEQNANQAGISDLSFGAKYALVYGPTQVLTLQMRVITPTGRTTAGLGTGITWLEPGLLYQRQMSARWQVFGQLKDQIFLERQSDFTGNVLTYGLGSSYVVSSGKWGYVAPVGELVGWTALSGKEVVDPIAGTVADASGDTIVNAKIGVRIGFGQSQLGQAFPTGSDLYIGYGRALTGEVWYKDMFRVEFRKFF